MLPIWKRGDRLTHGKLNGPVSFINQHLNGVNQARSQAQAPINAGRVKRFRVKSIQGDYITCRTWDGTTEGANDVLIAKPYQLRNSITSRNSISYSYTNTTERVANDGTDTETQVVVPSYVVDDEIFAIGKAPTGVDDGTDPITWLDLNLDARAWAKKAS